MKNLKGKKIAVIVGGPSTEAAVSRNSGKNVAAALRAKGYDPIITELVPEEWARTLKEGQFDIVFNALHGRYGEDGVLQGTCEMMNVPYTGPGVMASAVGMNKVVSKSAFVG
ncbi:MAG: D-alanine--D-alanine ligase, partial [Megasphaera micronuciformis]|nr:D-alanine--D-alanine ligase [Megasphaera micronuciformis]